MADKLTVLGADGRRKLLPAVSNSVLVRGDTGVVQEVVVAAKSLVGRQEGDSIGVLDQGAVDNLVNRRDYVNGDSGTLTEGMAVFLFGSEQVVRAVANDLATAQFFGAVGPFSITVGNSGQIQKGGIISVPLALQLGGSWGEGKRIYLSTVSHGHYTTVPPTTSGHFVVPVGVVAPPYAGFAAFVLIDRGEMLEIL